LLVCLNLSENIHIKQKQKCISVLTTTVIGVGSAFNILDNYWLLSGMILM
jgi:hypothetical protein